MPDLDLYEAVLSRTSVRRYDGQPLSEETRFHVQQAIARVRPLSPDSSFKVTIRDGAIGQELAAVIGGYGRLLSAPHCLVPHMVGGDWSLVDLGFRMEQIAVSLVQLGLGSCFVGVLGNEPVAVSHWNAPPAARIGAVLLCGKPAQGVPRVLGGLVRRVIGADSRLPVEQLFFSHGFTPGEPPDELRPLLEAGRWAPSARNAQPWRWLWAQDTLTLFVTRRNRRYGKLPDYALFDGGLCMANISMAMQARGMPGAWELLGTDPVAVPPHPDDLIPLARLTLG
jgi:nitroreductase